MLRLLYTNAVKIKRTTILLLMISLPIIYALLMSLYFKTNTRVTENQSIRAYYLLLTIASLFVLSIVSAQFIDIERSAGHYAALMYSGIMRWKILLGQWLFIFMILSITQLIASSVFSFGYRWCYGHPLPMVENLKLMGNSIYFLAPMIIIYLISAYRFDFTFTVLLAMLMTLSAILLGTTNLGIGVWQVLPWVWGVRVAFEGAGFTLYVSNGLCTIGLFILSVYFFNRWEYGV